MIGGNIDASPLDPVDVMGTQVPFVRVSVSVDLLTPAAFGALQELLMVANNLGQRTIDWAALGLIPTPEPAEEPVAEPVEEAVAEPAEEPVEYVNGADLLDEEPDWGHIQA